MWASVPWGQIGPGALVALFVVLVFTGRLVPRAYLKDSERREQEWRSLALVSQQQAGELVSLTQELTKGGQASQAMIEAITDIARERRGEVEPKDLRA